MEVLTEWLGRIFGGSPIIHIIDISIISYLIYRLIHFADGTRMMNLLKGIAVIIGAKLVSSMLGLETLDWLLAQMINYGVMAMIIIFQPELRRALEMIGRQVFRERNSSFNPSQKLITDLEESLIYMSRRKIGALISIEGNDSLQEFIHTGTSLDAWISNELLINIFIPNTPLHDGAVIIKDYKIAAASCYLPLSKSEHIPKELGTRHRAAVGLSEVSDALTLIVSEETGDISLVSQDHFHRGIDREELRDLLMDYLYMKNEEEERVFWRFVLNFFKGGEESA